MFRFEHSIDNIFRWARFKEFMELTEKIFRQRRTNNMQNKQKVYLAY